MFFSSFSLKMSLSFCCGCIILWSMKLTNWKWFSTVSFLTTYSERSETKSVLAVGFIQLPDKLAIHTTFSETYNLCSWFIFMLNVERWMYFSFFTFFHNWSVTFRFRSLLHSSSYSFLSCIVKCWPNNLITMFDYD